jgi:hypothetical protein
MEVLEIWSYHEANFFSHFHSACLRQQGWSILVTDLTVYFICWEGATSARGVNYFQELEGSPCLSSLVATNSNFVLPIHPTATTPSADHISLPFSTPYESAIQNDTSEVEIVAERNGHVGDIVVDALESISCLSYREQAGNADFCLSDIMPPSPRRRKTLSHREKGIRLLRQCSSWTQLEVTQDKIKEQGIFSCFPTLLFVHAENNLFF